MSENRSNKPTTSENVIPKKPPIEGDQKLQEIMFNVQEYLQHFGNNRFFILLTMTYYYRCCRSWSTISEQIDVFLVDPKRNYTALMFELDREIAKFSKNSFYGKQLQALAKLIATGPAFSLNERSF